jgi:tetratricopeptide (TPR) repeat protein
MNNMAFHRQPTLSPDDLANRLQREGKIDQLEGELQRYSVSDLSEKQKESYLHLWGITAFRRRDRAEAFRRFQEGLAACPDSKDLLFALGQEYEYRRETDRMFECFDRCSFPTTSSRFMLAAARYAYLWNRPDKGTVYVMPIAEAYFTLGVADDHFVYVRGLPFFSQTWDYLVAFALLSKDFRPTDEYLARAAKQLTEYDFQPVQQFYECVKRGDYAPSIKGLEARLKEWDSRFPAGYLRVKLAALKARCAGNVGEALAALDEVRLGTNDFPWLVDVLTIHKAWAYKKAGDTASETREVDRFFAKQPLLFEPDHAVSFAFLPYQETLKPRYQGGNVGQGGVPDRDPSGG